MVSPLRPGTAAAEAAAHATPADRNGTADVTQNGTDPHAVAEPAGDTRRGGTTR